MSATNTVTDTDSVIVGCNIFKLYSGGYQKNIFQCVNLFLYAHTVSTIISYDNASGTKNPAVHGIESLT